MILKGSKHEKEKYSNYRMVPGAKVLATETSVEVGSQISSKKFKSRLGYLAVTWVRIDYLPTS